MAMRRNLDQRFVPFLAGNIHFPESESTRPSNLHISPALC